MSIYIIFTVGAWLGSAWLLLMSHEIKNSECDGTCFPTIIPAQFSLFRSSSCFLTCEFVRLLACSLVFAFSHLALAIADVAGMQ